MDLSIFPTAPAAIATVAGAAVICAVIIQWLKAWLAEERVYNVAGFGLTFVLVEIAGLFLVDGAGAWERCYVGFFVALFGASLATFGYEALTNLFGLAGIGKRG